MPTKNSTTVTIAGVAYTLTSSDSTEHILECAKIVDKQINALTKSYFGYPEAMISVLAACNIADEYLKLKELSENTLKIVEENKRLQQENQKLLREIARINNSRVRNNNKTENNI